MPSSADCCHLGPGGAHDREHLVVGDLASQAPGVERGRRSSPRTSTCCRCRRSCAGRAERRRSATFGSSSRSLRGAPLVELGGEDVGGKLAERRVEARTQLREQLEHRAVELGPPRRARSAGPARRGGPRAASAGRRGRSPTSRSCAGASGSSGCRRSARTGACRASRRSLTTPARELVGPALAAQAGVEVRDLRREALDERPDAARGVVDRVALGHPAWRVGAAGSVTSRGGGRL